MRGKTSWITAVCLLGLTLLVASCATAPATAPTATTGDKGSAATPAGKTVPGTTVPSTGATPVASAEEKPKYGGTLNVVWTTDPTSIDQVVNTFYKVNHTDLTHDYLTAGDWSQGQAGAKNSTFWISGVNDFTGSKTCILCESWEFVEPGHMVFKIRQGVNFALDPNNEASKLVNGREMTAEDIAYSYNRFLAGNKYVQSAEPKLVESAVITAPDKYTLDLKFAPEATLRAHTMMIWGVAIVPKEVIEKYGDMNDWKNFVGQGPYMLTNYTSGASMSFTKNPNYWQKDPIGAGKGNQLPYMDGVKILILPDPSTRLTALRTGKVDQYGGTPALVKDDYDGLIATAPKLNTVKILSAGTNGFYMRVDKEDLPFKDIRVRRAMAMAVDYKGIVENIMGGDGEYPGFPTASIPDFKGVHYELSELPAEVQEIYSYNPEKAKQLLAEAGYANGFKAEVLVNSTLVTTLDEVAVFKEAWDKIGVNVTIKPMENAAYNKAFTSKDYDTMAYGIYGSHGIYLGMLNWVGGTVYNGTWGKEPKAQQTKDIMTESIAKGDIPKAEAAYKEFSKEMIGKVWTIPYPRSYNYIVWWPWLKNYHGETSVGYLNGFSWAAFAWLDQDLKKSMGY